MADPIKRTEKETLLRRELNQVREQMDKWSRILGKLNADPESKNIGVSMTHYAAGLKKVVDAN